MNAYKPLHTLHDNSVIRIIGAKDLIQIPVWHGNRIIDTAHVAKMKDSIGQNVQKLDFGYRIVTYEDTDAGGHPIKVSCIIDGQHRHKVLYDYFHTELCVPDFPVVILEKIVNSESEIITYFKELNNQKPIQWASDPNMLANEYIKELSLAFNKKKDLMIRPKATTRPYLSAEKLREILVRQANLMKDSLEEIKAFVARVVKYNTDSIEMYQLNSVLDENKQNELIQKAVNHEFVLAVDSKLPWVRKCLLDN